MRCILVNDANLKSDTLCTYCRKKIGDSYAREVGSRLVYCNYECYRSAVEAPAIALTAHATLSNTWIVNS